MSSKSESSPRTRSLLLFSLTLLALLNLTRLRAAPRLPPRPAHQAARSVRAAARPRHAPRCRVGATRHLLPAHEALPPSLKRYVRAHAYALARVPRNASVLRAAARVPPILLWRCVRHCDSPAVVLRGARLAFLLAVLARRVLLLDLPVATRAALPHAALDWRVPHAQRTAVLHALYGARDARIAHRVHLTAPLNERKGGKQQRKQQKKKKQKRELRLDDARLAHKLQRLPRVLVVSLDDADRLLAELARNPALPADVRSAPDLALARAVAQTLFRPGDEAVRYAAAARPDGVSYVGAEAATLCDGGGGDAAACAGVAACVRRVYSPARDVVLLSGAGGRASQRVASALRDAAASGDAAEGLRTPVVHALVSARADNRCVRVARAVADAVALGSGSALVAGRSPLTPLSETAALLGSAPRVVLAQTGADGRTRCDEVLS